MRSIITFHIHSKNLGFSLAACGRQYFCANFRTLGLSALYSYERPEEECQMMVEIRLESSLCVVPSSSIRRINFVNQKWQKEIFLSTRFSAKLPQRSTFFTQCWQFYTRTANHFIINFPRLGRRQQKIPSITRQLIYNYTAQYNNSKLFYNICGLT